MKKLTLLLAALLTTVGLQAQTSETDNIQRGTTIGHYSKPGAPIEMSYTSTKVDSNVTADINITLSTTVPSGTMSVVITLDDALTEENDVEKNLSFVIDSQQKTYPINLQISSMEDGLHYIRLLTQIDKAQGSKLRAFAVPVYIGENPQPKNKGIAIMKAKSGENLSVSKAVETIEVIK